MLAKGETLRQMAEEQQIAPVSGLSQQEITVLAVLAGSVVPPRGTLSYNNLKVDAEKAGLTTVAISFGIVRLKNKEFIAEVTEEDHNGWEYTAFFLTESGWNWMEQNESHFVLRRATRSKGEKIDDYGASAEISDDDIPF